MMGSMCSMGCVSAGGGSDQVESSAAVGVGVGAAVNFADGGTIVAFEGHARGIFRQETDCDICNFLGVGLVGVFPGGVLDRFGVSS